MLARLRVTRTTSRKASSFSTTSATSNQNMFLTMRDMGRRAQAMFIKRYAFFGSMCGICGFMWEDKKLLREMMRSISYRGSDQNGTFFDKGISLGHSGLKNHGFAERGGAPVFNGEGDICVIF